MYEILGSRRIPIVCGLMLMGSVVLFICSASCVLNSAGSGVKRVYVIVSGFSIILFVCVHV